MMNSANFLHADTNLEKLKMTLINIVWKWSNMVMAFLGNVTHKVCCISRIN